MSLAIIPKKDENEDRVFTFKDLDTIPDILALPKEAAVEMVKDLINLIWDQSIVLNGRRLVELRVSPRLAQLFLTASQGNRNISNEHVQKYKRAMLEGKWVESTNMCTILKTFELGDAHHRMWAQVESGVTLNYTAHIDASRDELASLDCGRSRTLANLVSIMSKQKVSPAITNILKYVMVYDGGQDLSVLRSGTTRAKHAAFNQYEIEKVFQDNKNLAIQAGSYCSSVSKKFPSPTAVGYTYFVLVKKYKSEAALFFERLRSGADFESGSILHLLHEKLISMKNHTKRYLNEEVEFFIFKAWNIYHDKRTKTPKVLVRGKAEEIKRPY